MKNVILFGGTFDPPHNGHTALLRAAIEKVQPQQVIVMPTGTPPHKQAHAVSAALRLDMCRCFLPLFPNTVISTLEIERAGKSYTIDTLRTLQVQMPNARFFLPMGSDMLLYFPKWFAWQEILRYATLVVQSRQNEDAAPVQAMSETLVAAGATLLFTDAAVTRLSSTEVRTAVENSQPYSALVPPVVAQIIAQNQLYQASEQKY